MAHTLLSEFALSYASNMTLGSVTSTVSGVSTFSGTTSYTHDTKLQLTQESSNRAGSYTNSNGYDSAGNPTTFKGVTQTFNSANQNNTTSAGYSYDGNGNPTSYKSNTLSFDVENRLTAYGTALTAGYRADGQRAWKQNSSGVRTYFFYDGDKLLYETNSSGTVSAENTWADTGLLARSTSTRTLLYTWDAQGNVCQQLDASTGSIVESYMFDAFGTRGTNGSDTAAMNDPYAGFGGSQGYYQDTETGLLLLGHRYYDSTTGRFLTRDPISYAGGINLYEYTNNSPLGGHDASGFTSGEIIGGIIGDGASNGAKDGGLECFSTLIKIGFTPGCETQKMCQLRWNCLLDMLWMTLCQAAFALFEVPPAASGCLCGAIEGGLHYAVDYNCAKSHPCGKEKEWNWKCFWESVGGGFLSGCIGGWLGGIGEQLTKKVLIYLLNALKIGISAGIDAGVDNSSACKD